MEKYICIHGHFYQPPRENPWLEAVEMQGSAYPYHDWNERINSECYAPNSASRIVDSECRIIDIANNYARISFNFGPTLLSWMERNASKTYQAILNADKQSVECRSGHGNALTQIYNHIIMPLANSRDKRTQILWGIKDFEYRFKRFPEGMWLSETAVDNETLDILAECGIKFTILAPRQAWRVRQIGIGKWQAVKDSRIDPTRPYLCKLTSGRTINLFFYDGPISQAVAFENLLKKGEEFADRLLSGFSDHRQWPQILHIATDGETYGHHLKFGDMALAFALDYIESQGLAKLTNYGEYLEAHPPTHEVRIFENSSWSCVHGVERWKSDCGCNSCTQPGWNQQWRKPLRDALDWLRDRIVLLYENTAGEYLKNCWEARDNYIDVILNRSGENMTKFLERHSSKSLNSDERVTVLKLLEIQRHAMLMYTSCGWFFDDISGIETIQILQYAGRAIQLSEEVFHENIEDTFITKLALAKSNISIHENGAQIYKKFVKPAIIDLIKVGAHYAINSLFEEYNDETYIYSYVVKKEDFQKVEAGTTKLAVGRIAIFSEITEISAIISFCVLHFGGHSLNGGVRTFLGPDFYESMKKDIISTFGRGDFADIIRLMDSHFGMHNYSLTYLFKDQQRNILNLLITKTLNDLEKTYRQVYENSKILMGLLRETGMPLKRAFLSTAEVILNIDIKKAFMDEPLELEKVQNLITDATKLGVAIDFVDIEFTVRRLLEGQMKKLYANPSDIAVLLDIQQRLELLKSLPGEINFWQIQNVYYEITKKFYHEINLKASSGEKDAILWVNAFKYLGEMLYFTSSVLQ
ncbi:MAG: DUF3536 domain-containing protein [Syntrophales bacterium]